MKGRSLAVLLLLVLAVLAGIAWWLTRPPEEILPTAPAATTTPAPEAAAPEAAPAKPVARPARAWVLRGQGGVTGTLREYGTDRPLGGVKVLLAAGVPGPGVSLETTTLADGSFLIGKVPNFDAWTLTALVPAPLAELVVAGVEVIETRNTDLGILYATPGFAVPGIVVDEAGAPVAGAEVRAVRARPVQARYDFLRIIRELPRPNPAVDSAMTGADGRFSLRRVPPGNYDLEVAAKGFRLDVEHGLVVAPDAATREIRVVLSRGFVLRGRVVRRTEGPIEGLRIVGIEQPRQETEMFQTMGKSLAVTSETGEFTLEGLGPGTHAIGVECDNEPYHLALNVEVPRDSFLEIVIEGDAWLEGVVADAAGAPIPAAQVYVTSFRSTTPLVGFAVTDREGHYRINALKSGPIELFMVQAEGFGTYPEDFLSIMRGGGQGELILRPGKNEKDVRLGKGGIVRGRVLEQGTENGVEGVRVSLATMASLFGGQRSATSDAQGHFEITSVPVGGAVLTASKDGWVQPGLTPQSMVGMAMSMFASKGATDSGQGLLVVVSAAGEVVARDLELSRGTFLRGTVVSPAGAPVPGARVSVEFASTPGGMMKQVQQFLPVGEPRLAGPEGTFELPAPSAGQKVALVARAQGFLDGRSEDLETKTEPIEGIVLHLRQGAVLAGRVTTTDGKPLEGASVRYTPMEDGQDWGRRWRLWGATASRTDETGAFRILNVEPRRLIVQFSHPSRVSVSREGVEAVDGKTVEVSAELPAALAISGKAIGPDGKPVAAARIDVRAPNPLPEGTDPYFRAPDDQTVNADGSFVLEGLVAGKFRIRAMADGFADSDTAEVEAGGQPVTLRLGTGFLISGMVRTRQGAALGNVRVVATKQGERLDESANTNREGRFEIRDLPAGTYDVRAEAGWGMGSSRPNLIPANVAGVAAGTQDLLIEVEEGLSISGTVTRADGTALPEGWIHAQQVPRPGETGTPVSGNGPVLDGKFDVPGLAPGRYSVTVGGNDVPQKTVQADAGTEGLAIRYGQGGAIEGRLLRPDGTGAPGAWVSAQGSEGSTAAQTGPDGRFSIRELPAGTYTVMAGMQADGKSLHASTANVSVAVGGTTSGLELTLAE